MRVTNQFHGHSYPTTQEDNAVASMCADMIVIKSEALLCWRTITVPLTLVLIAARAGPIFASIIVNKSVLLGTRVIKMLRYLHRWID